MECLGYSVISMLSSAKRGLVYIYDWDTGLLILI